MSDLGFWGGLLSGVGRGLETWQALRQAEDDRRQREWEREQQLINQRLDLARASMANAEGQGFVLSPEAQRNWQKALLAPDEPTGGDLASIGNADAPLRQAVPAVHQSLAAEEGRVAGEPINRALQLASMLPTGSNPRANGSGLTAWYQNMTPRGVTGDVHDLGGGVSLVDPNFAGPATAEVQGQYGLQKEGMRGQTAKDVAEITTDPARDIRRREFAPRSAGGGTGSVQDRKAIMGARTAVRAIDAMMDLIRGGGIGASQRSLTTDFARGVQSVPVLGKALSGVTEPIAQQGMTDAQSVYDTYLNQIAHTTVGLLPGSRQSMVLFNNMRQVYEPIAGMSEATRRAKVNILQNLRQDLIDTWLGGEDPANAPHDQVTPAPVPSVGGRPLRRAEDLQRVRQFFY